MRSQGALRCAASSPVSLGPGDTSAKRRSPSFAAPMWSATAVMERDGCSARVRTATTLHNRHHAPHIGLPGTPTGGGYGQWRPRRRSGTSTGGGRWRSRRRFGTPIGGGRWRSRRRSGTPTGGGRWRPPRRSGTADIRAQSLTPPNCTSRAAEPHHLRARHPPPPGPTEPRNRRPATTPRSAGREGKVRTSGPVPCRTPAPAWTPPAVRPAAASA